MCEGEGGPRWKFYILCAGSSEPSLVANSISTQISCAGSNFACVLAGSKMDDKEREKNVVVFFIFILFDTSVAFYASMFCDSVQIM